MHTLACLMPVISAFNLPSEPTEVAQVLTTQNTTFKLTVAKGGTLNLLIAHDDDSTNSAKHLAVVFLITMQDNSTRIIVLPATPNGPLRIRTPQGIKVITAIANNAKAIVTMWQSASEEETLPSFCAPGGM